MARLRGFWGYAFPQLLIMASSVVYEMIEWFAAVYFGGDLGMQYLGTQGDPWDGNKDMALASLGSLVAMAIVAAVNAFTQPDFRADWRASLTARDTAPLGDRELIERWRARGGR
jgi:putative membrane protein